MTAAPLLQLRGLSRYYQSGDTVVKALDAVDLAIDHGEFVAIMGQSGSGKSTLMNILGCLDRPTAGSYHISGQDVSVLDADELAALRRQTFGFIFQRYNLLSTATALENVEIPAIYAGMDKSDRKNRASDLLEKLGLHGRGNHRPTQLSGGQQQRVAIARALINDPPVILADEPTGALDSRSGAEVMTLLQELYEAGRTIILITHDEQVAAHAKRVVRVQDGRILSDVRTDTVSAVKTTSKQSSGAAPNIVAEASEAVQTALRALRVNIFRTSLTLLGIIIGVAAVVTMLAVGQGSKDKVLEQISAMGTNLLSVRPGGAGIRSSGDIATMTMDDASVIESIPNVDVVVPERSGRVTVRFGNIDYATQAQGVGASFPQARDWPAARGSFFTAEDVSSYAPVAVLGQTVAGTLFPNGEEPIGAYILIGTIPFQVIGVMASKGAAPWGGDQDDAVFIPVTTGLTRVFGQTYLNGLTVRVRDTAAMEETESAITALLTQRHGSEDFRVRNTASLLETATATQNTLTVLLGAVAAISLLVGGIGVMNIMLVSVTERTREIGIRIATGARQRDIMVQFITEAAVVCIIGGLLGVGIGFLSGWIISLFGAEVVFTAGPALIAFSCAVLIGLVFGWLPARTAARLDPVVALAAE